MTLTAVAAVLWSTGGVLIKILPFDAMTILFYRSMYALVVFLIYFRALAFNINKKTILASLSYAPLLILFVSATKLTTAANAILLQYLAPLFILLIEPYIEKTKISRVNLITVISCTLGMVVFFYDQMAAPEQWLGIIFGILSGFMLACFILFQRFNEPTHQPGAIVLGNLWILIISAPWFFESAAPTVTEHGILLFMGVIQIGMGYVLFTLGQKYISAMDSSIIAMIEPVLNPIWVVIGYGEIPSIFALIGGIIILGTLVLRLLWLKKSREIPSITV